MNEWKDLVEAASSSATTPEKEVLDAWFYTIWNRHYPELKPSKGGSGYCDKCYFYKTSIESAEPELKEDLVSHFEKHKRDANSEYSFYRKCTNYCKIRPEDGLIHIVFDFAEKVSLPSYRKQPGCLYFVTGLKFDLFGVSSSNLKTQYVFGLPEGHWPNAKTADEVASMLMHVLELHVESPLTFRATHLRLHADNCSGQNKNKFLLFLMLYLVMYGKFKSVELCFMIAGHTKNSCDGSFGSMKKNTDVEMCCNHIKLWMSYLRVRQQQHAYHQKMSSGFSGNLSW